MEDRKTRLAALTEASRKSGRHDMSFVGRTTYENDDATTLLQQQQQQQQSTTDDRMIVIDTQPIDTNKNSINSKRKIHFRNYIPSDLKLINDDDDNNNNNNTNNNNKNELDDNTTDKVVGTSSFTSQQYSKTTTSKSALQIALDKARLEIINTTTPGRATDRTTTVLNNNNNNEGKIESESKLPVVVNEYDHTKINGDLKRKIQSQLNRLEKRTQKALVTLLRQRLERDSSHEEKQID